MNPVPFVWLNQKNNVLNESPVPHFMSVLPMSNLGVRNAVEFRKKYAQF